MRILVVDDHPLVRDGMRAGIRLIFPTALIAEAGSAPEALATISAQPLDLVLLDVNLPGQNGIDLARRIRAANKHVKILVVAGEADPWTVNEAIEVGVSGFMTKTRSADFLQQAIQAVLEGKIVLCPDSEAALQRAEHGSGAATEPPGPSVLSERERQVLKHIAHGENTKTTASLLQISPKTVEAHRQHIMGKLGLQSVVALTHYAIRHGLTPI
jgi:DNA-binding NarL/FixJ family response regulator